MKSSVSNKIYRIKLFNNVVSLQIYERFSLQQNYNQLILQRIKQNETNIHMNIKGQKRWINHLHAGNVGWLEVEVYFPRCKHRFWVYYLIPHVKIGDLREEMCFRSVKIADSNHLYLCSTHADCKSLREYLFLLLADDTFYRFYLFSPRGKRTFTLGQPIFPANLS